MQDRDAGEHWAFQKGGSEDRLHITSANIAEVPHALLPKSKQ